MEDKKLQQIVMYVLIAVFALICLGTVAIPAVLALIYTWKWLLLYPVCLIVLLILVPKKKTT